MITKTIEHQIIDSQIRASIIRYRVFGILVYKKTAFAPDFSKLKPDAPAQWEIRF